MANLSDRLVKLHREKETFKKNIAEAIGVTARQYKRYEMGINEPTAGVLIKLADFYDCSIDYLVGRSETKERQP